MQNHMDKYQLRQSSEGSDLTLFAMMVVASSVGFCVLLAHLFDAPFTSMWVTVPGMVLGLVVSVAVAWRLRKIRMDRMTQWNREKAQIAEAETQRKMEDMWKAQSRIPEVRK